MKYAIVYADSLTELVDVVNNFIKDGWEPLGAPFVVENIDHRTGYRAFQALTKKEIGPLSKREPRAEGPTSCPNCGRSD